MLSSRPYLLRALYEWIVDSAMTPHILVKADVAGVAVPGSYVKDGQIVLNIAPAAVQGLELGNEFVSFNARFGGSPTDIVVPTEAVLAIYARENGQGMAFPEGAAPESPEPPDAPNPAGSGKRPRLKLVE